jgi:hypothetical protein
MTTWVDKSDKRGRFFDGGDFSGQKPNDCISELLNCLLDKIVGHQEFGQFDLLLFEVNCDTGRVIVAATTLEKYAYGSVDGCSLRSQPIQDFWYDLLESNPSDEKFTAAISERVFELGMAFRAGFIETANPIFSSSFTYRVYGNDREVVVYEEKFSSKQR